MVQTINLDTRMRISAQNEMPKTVLLFLYDASKLRLLSYETFGKELSPHKVSLTICQCANKQQ